MPPDLSGKSLAWQSSPVRLRAVKLHFRVLFAPNMASETSIYTYNFEAYSCAGPVRADYCRDLQAFQALVPAPMPVYGGAFFGFGDQNKDCRTRFTGGGRTQNAHHIIGGPRGR